MATYRCHSVGSDPKLDVAIPVNIYNELAKRARDSGRSLETELNIRLARTFEVSEAQMIEDALISAVLTSAQDFSEQSSDNSPPPKGR